MKLIGSLHVTRLFHLLGLDFCRFEACFWVHPWSLTWFTWKWPEMESRRFWTWKASWLQVNRVKLWGCVFFWFVWNIDVRKSVASKLLFPHWKKSSNMVYDSEIPNNHRTWNVISTLQTNGMLKLPTSTGYCNRISEPSTLRRTPVIV